MPIISVVIPSYNAASYIGRAVSSALAQTCRDIEVIVVDDGSTDDTAQVVGGCADHRVCYLRQAHGERSTARNTGIGASSGDYVAFLDADDWWRPEKLERQLALFDRNPALGAVHCWLQLVGPTDKPLRVLRGGHTASDPNGAFVFDQLLLGNIGGPGSSLMVSRELIKTIGGFKPGIAYGEDWDFCLRVAHQSQIGFAPEPLVFYRMHGVFMPEKMDRLKMQEAVVVVVRDALALHGIPEADPLARKALARVFCQGGLVDAGVGNYASASRRLTEAMLLDPSISAIESIAYFANGLYDTITPLDEALSYVTRLLDQLTGPAQMLQQFRSQMLGLTSAIQVFEGSAQGEPQRARDAFWHAVRYAPGWLRNRGFVKCGVRAHLPKGVSWLS